MGSVLIIDAENHILSIPLSQETTDKNRYRVLRPALCFGVSLKDYKGASAHPWTILQDYIEAFKNIGFSSIKEEVIDELRDKYKCLSHQIVLPRISKEVYSAEATANYPLYALSAENLHKTEKELKKILDTHEEYLVLLDTVFTTLEQDYTTKPIKFVIGQNSIAIDFKALKNLLTPQLMPKEEVLLNKWKTNLKDPAYLSNLAKIDLSEALLNNYLKPLRDITTITTKKQAYVRLAGSYTNQSLGVPGPIRGTLYNDPEKIEEIYFTPAKAKAAVLNTKNQNKLLENYMSYTAYYEDGVLKKITILTELQKEKDYRFHAQFAQELNQYIEKLNLEAAFPVASQPSISKTSIKQKI